MRIAMLNCYLDADIVGCYLAAFLSREKQVQERKLLPQRHDRRSGGIKDHDLYDSRLRLLH